MASHSDSSHLIRLCHPDDHSIFFSLDDVETGKFGGVFGHLTNEIIALIRRMNNGTMVIWPRQGFGDPTDEPGMFTGCIGRLQRNQSDILFYPSDYPFEAKHIQQGLIMYDVKFVISQAYFLHETSDDEFQILNTLLIYKEIWFYMVIVVLLVLGVIRCRRWLLSRAKRIHPRVTRSLLGIDKMKRKYQDFTKVMAHSYRLGSVDDDTLFDKIIFFSLSIFALYVVHYYSSLIKTSLVVVGKPDLWESYEDMMATKTPPYFIKGFNAEWYFINAKKGSEKAKFWNWIENNFNLSDILVPGNPAKFSDYALRMIEGETALIADNIMARTVSLAACGFRARNQTEIAGVARVFLDANSRSAKKFAEPGYEKKLINKLSSYLTTQIGDSGEEYFLKGLMFSEYFTGKNALVFKRKTRFFNEFGLSVKTAEIVATTDIFAPYMSTFKLKTDASKLNLVEDCLTGSDIHDSVDVDSIDIGRLFQLTLVVVSIFTVALIILTFESCRSHIGDLLN